MDKQTGFDNIGYIKTKRVERSTILNHFDSLKSKLRKEMNLIDLSSHFTIVDTSSKYLLEAKHALGQILTELGDNSPYVKDEDRKSREDIVPTAEQSTQFFSEEQIDSYNVVELISHLRLHISLQMRSFEKTLGGIKCVSREEAIWRTQHYVSMNKSKHWLGELLALLKP